MDFMKKHKMKLILLGILILVFIISLFAIVSLLYPDLRKDIYGNRLSGISDVKISNQVITKVKDDLNFSKIVVNTDYVLKGKLINFIVKVKKDTNINDAKKLPDIILESIEDKIQEYYDIQVIIIEETEENEKYPIMAYKHKTSKTFVWTNN